VLLNPALLAKAKPEDNITVVLPAVGVQITDKDNLQDEIDDISVKSVDISSSLMCKRAQYITFFCAHFDQKQYASHFYGDNVTQSP
ncbi:conjugal transfer protein TraF, partial [Salmonella enterica subsp. enterica serovar Montevideo]|nr:conjugal transfer protein TraF [Salmonella enterica subsp. enterica serovar Montevideo]